MYQYSAIVKKVIDGDTLEINIDLGLAVWVHNEKIRLYGINTPEVYGVKRDSPEWVAGNNASEFVKSVLKENDEIRIETIKDRKEKYGRYLAIVYARIDLNIIAGLSGIRNIGDLYCVNDILIGRGLAVPYMI
jgi:micrococcal nuclease